MENSIFFTTDLLVPPETVTPDMAFSDFYRIYRADMQARLKPATLATKDAVMEGKVLPFFGALPMNAITPRLVRRWQSDLLSQGYSDTYLRTIDMHLSSVFKYADRYYDLENPCARADHIGSGNARKLDFWTLEEYRAFLRACRDCPEAFTAFELLYWCGIRVGELLALTPQDITPDGKLLKITKSYSRQGGHDVISSPKTPGSVRDVAMPDFLCSEVADYIRSAGIKKNARIIPHTADFLKYRLKTGCGKTGVKRIRIHDIRHSHVSLLIDQGFSAAAIAARVGHSRISTTVNVYAHLFPDRQAMLADALQAMHDGTFRKEVACHA